jgi:hypothetical protein
MRLLVGPRRQGHPPPAHAVEEVWLWPELMFDQGRGTVGPQPLGLRPRREGRGKQEGRVDEGGGRRHGNGRRLLERRQRARLRFECGGGERWRLCGLR